MIFLVVLITNKERRCSLNAESHGKTQWELFALILLLKPVSCETVLGETQHSIIGHDHCTALCAVTHTYMTKVLNTGGSK